jgi:parvulin-like peptidyl-prolyl isomerase
MVKTFLHTARSSTEALARRRSGLRAPGRAMCCALASAAALAAGGCGGSGRGTASSADAPPATSASSPTSSADAPPAASGSSPNAVIVRVGGHAITEAVFAHALAGLEKFEGLRGDAPVPPGFTACIAHLRATASGQGTAALRQQCQQQYEGLVKQALGPQISRQWVLGGAAEAGLSVSEAELKRQLKHEEAGQSRAQVAANLATEDETLAEFALETKVKLLAEKIRHKIAARTAFTSAQVNAYYKAHKSQFETPERRRLYIARTATEAEALKVKHEIVSGKSFTSVVNGLRLEQPIYSQDGLVAQYTSNLYQEPPLNNAIMSAKPNVVSGPVKISLGYYVFEVNKVTPALPDPRAQALATIRTDVQLSLYRQALAAYVSALRTRWRARTECQPGYVVGKCAGAPAEHEDPYTLG